MLRKTVSGMVLMLLLMGFLMVAFNIQPVESDWTWTESIYIRADGRVDPPAAPISTVDNITYTFTDNIIGDIPHLSWAIIVQRNNIVVDGAGCILQDIGYGNGFGIYLSHISNVTIRNIEIRALAWAIRVTNSRNIHIYGNSITDCCDRAVVISYCNNTVIYANNMGDNWVCIDLMHSNYSIVSQNRLINSENDALHLHEAAHNVVSHNNVTNKRTYQYINYGIGFSGRSHNNTFYGNNIQDCDTGIMIATTIVADNKFYHNNFTNNQRQICAYKCYFYDLPESNIWDDGYPSGGNYWSNYAGVDNYHGPNQDIPGSDGIGDTPYAPYFVANNQDNYPLMNPYVFHNTPVGTNATFTDTTNDVTVIFDEVTEAGDTTIVTSGTGPPPPSGFKLVPSAPPVYYQITTTAAYTGMIEIAIPYDETEVMNERNLQLMHWDEETHRWIDVTTWIDEENNIIHGEVSSLSVFAVMESLIPVGGIWVSINKFELLAPAITLASLLAVATVSIIYVRHRKKQQT